MMMPHNPRCACGCVPNVPSMFEMAELRRQRKLQKEQKAMLTAAEAPMGKGVEEQPVEETQHPQQQQLQQENQQQQQQDQQHEQQQAQQQDLATAQQQQLQQQQQRQQPELMLQDSNATELQRLRALLEQKKALEKEVHQQRQFRASMLSIFEPKATERVVEVSMEVPRGGEVVNLSWQVEQDAAFAQGGLLWSSGSVLARFLATSAMVKGYFKSFKEEENPQAPRILELGSGAAALPSVVAAYGWHCEVVATDLPSVIDRFAPNLRTNFTKLTPKPLGTLDFRSLVWTDVKTLGHFDLILAADLIYDPSLHADLIRLLADFLLAGAGGPKSSSSSPQHSRRRCWMTFAVRDKASEAHFFEQLDLLGISMTELKQEGPADLQSSGNNSNFPIKLVELARKTSTLTSCSNALGPKTSPQVAAGSIGSGTGCAATADAAPALFSADVESAAAPAPTPAAVEASGPEAQAAAPAQRAAAAAASFASSSASASAAPAVQPPTSAEADAAAAAASSAIPDEDVGGGIYL